MVPVTWHARMYLWWSLCTLYVSEDVPVVEFMYLVHIRGCTCGGVYVPCMYQMYLWWSLRTLYLLACQVRVAASNSGLCCCLFDVFPLLINSLVC